MIRNKLRDIRFEFKMEQNDFAEAIGANKTQYNKWEHQNGQPGLEWVLKISLITGKPIESFIELDLTDEEMGQLALLQKKFAK